LIAAWQSKTPRTFTFHKTVYIVAPSCRYQFVQFDSERN
jgi:hypothetical protein